MSLRLAILCSHPIQYYSPWFRHLASRENLLIKVFFLWDFGVRPTWDPGFQKTIHWDIPLLDGFDHELVPNTSADPGTHHFRGLTNPSLKQRVCAWNPDAVLIFGYNHESLLRFVLTCPARIPLLLRGDSHRLYPNKGWKHAAKEALAALFFRRYRAFLFCGRANADYFLSRGARPKQMFRTPHAIDMSHFQATPETRLKAVVWRQNLGIPEDAPIVLFAGKFEEKKRPRDLLQAFLQLSRQDVHLIFVGSGSLADSLKEDAAGRPRIHFLPFHNQGDMPMVYTAADVFVLPSFGNGETWGLAVQEALACETPVLISSHVGCHPDLVEGHDNGLVFEAGSVEGLRKALEQALSPGKLDSWIPNTRKSLENHTYEKATEGLFQALSHLFP